MEINLGENIIIKRGSRPTPLSKYEVNKQIVNSIPYPIQSDLNKNTFILDKCKKFIKTDLDFKFTPANKGDLLMSSSCDIGNVAILGFKEAFIDDKFFRLEVSNNVKINYLKYWIIKNKKEISDLGYGTTFKMLYIEPFKNFLNEKFIPNLEVQQEIINIIEPFEKLSHIINKKINYLLTIGDLVLLSSKSGKKNKIEDVCNVNIGSTPSTKIKDYWIGENEWLNSGILTNNLVVVKGSNFISSDAIKNKNLKESKYMNTFISIIEPSINKISLSSKSFYYNQSIANIEAKEEINKGFIFFKLRQVIKDLSLLSSGTAQKSVNKDKINNFFISISNENINLYNDLCFYFIKLHNQIEVINNLINKLINLYIS